MIRRLVRHVRRTNEDGAILILAILIISVVALVTGIVLTRGEGNIRATVALREVAGSTYAADGAAQVAINALRTGYSPGDPNGATADNEWAYNSSFDGTGCFGKNAAGDAVGTLVLPDFYPATGRQGAPTSAAVECVPEDATGAMGSPVPINNANKPGNAILTLGTSPAEIGLYAKPLNSGIPFRVHGGVWSNSNILADNGAIESSESIRAHTGCTGTMTAPIVQCGAATVPDPNYASDATLVGSTEPLTHRIPPTTCGTVVEFEPGYYDDAKALTDLTNRNACRNTTWWFKPGTYYFDFHNAADDPQGLNDVLGVADNSNPTQWTVGVGYLVAGTPTDVNGNVITSPGAAPTIPGSCQNPIDDTGTLGVQFIFGGESQLKFDGGARGEICGTYHTDRPPIAFYGLKNGTATPTQVTGADARTASAVPTPGLFTGATPEALAEVGGNAATWTNASGTQNTTINMTGFAPAATIPAGSVVTGATLQVTHRDDDDGNQSTVTITPDGGSALAAYTLPRRAASVQTDTIDLSTQSTAWTAFRKHVHDQGLTGASVAYKAFIRDAATATLDAVRLELTYYVPQFRAQTDAGYGASNCLKIGGGCNLLSTPTNYAGELYIQGTAYTPVTRIDLSLSGQNTAQVMRFGVIARSLAVKETGSFSYVGPVIELPDNSPGWGFSGTIVQLKVYVCPSQATCSAGSGELALKVRVQLWDPGGVPEPPNREVTVLSWSQQR